MKWCKWLFGWEKSLIADNDEQDENTEEQKFYPFFSKFTSPYASWWILKTQYMHKRRRELLYKVGKGWQSTWREELWVQKKLWVDNIWLEVALFVVSIHVKETKNFLHSHYSDGNSKPSFERATNHSSVVNHKHKELALVSNIFTFFSSKLLQLKLWLYVEHQQISLCACLHACMRRDICLCASTRMGIRNFN